MRVRAVQMGGVTSCRELARLLGVSPLGGNFSLI